MKLNEHINIVEEYNIQKLENKIKNKEIYINFKNNVLSNFLNNN